MTDRTSWEQHKNFGGMAAMLLHMHDSFRASSAGLLLLLDDDLPGVAARMRNLFGPLTATLHHHHQAEEAMLFPLVRKLTGSHPQALEDDHQTLMARLDELEVHLATRGREGADELLRALDRELREHLDVEEALCIPVLLDLSREDAWRLLYGAF